MARISAAVVSAAGCLSRRRARLVLEAASASLSWRSRSLGSLPLFAELRGGEGGGVGGVLRAAAGIEGQATAGEEVWSSGDMPAGTALLEQADHGDAYDAIACGGLDAWQDEHFLRRCARGEGVRVGQIALLRAIPRTASVIAHTSATAYRPTPNPS